MRTIEKRRDELIKWENEYFGQETADVKKMYHLYVQRLFDKVGDARKQKWLKKIDDCLFHLQAWLQHSQSNEDTRRRVIQYARTFDPDIDAVSDLRSLPLEQIDYLAEQLMAKQRLLAFGQGGLSGMGGAFLLAVDLPLIAFIQLQSLQQLALAYGYDSRRPVEMMYMLKLFHVATMPRSFQANEWDRLFAEINDQDDEVFYEGEESIFQAEWLDQLLKQLAKSFVITMLRKKMIQGVPLLGMAVGAGMNYRFSAQVIEIGQHFYQKRRLLEQMSNENF
ncbi:EcsC family protein [bacterium LRH843]|nr:EcsC family protein [bacterium LRH843]